MIGGLRYLLILLVLAPIAWCGEPTRTGEDLRCFPASKRAAQHRFESNLIESVEAASLRRFHESLGIEPHDAGSAGDQRVVEKLADLFAGLGLEVEKQELWLYLCRPVDAALEVVTPIRESLPLKEDVLSEDPYSGHPNLLPGWNAYSGSGDVTAEVVYANYGRKEDFEKLTELDVDASGKIVIARYGGNFRGYKAKFAEAAGAVGLILYTDPADSGYARGLMYPEGGYANPSSIQRGSIMTLNYAGDPLTPFVAATLEAERLDPAEVALPKIPVQPIGWSAADRILSRMRGRPVPQAWQGGLPHTYRLTGGDGLTVRLAVHQRRQLMKTYNVVGTLRGAKFPEQMVIVGCHHDAWGFGASDPLAGLMVLCESARTLAEAARAGHRPARSIVFGAWAAEEFGIIGSTEWVEAHGEELSQRAIAYINLDMAAMGQDFGASASPSLKRVISEAAKAVSSGGADGATVFDSWLKRNEDDSLPGHLRFGDLGGGSDHVGFYCHLAIPSAGLGAGGSQGTSYHSAYDNLAWYQKIVGSDYQSAVMVTRVTDIVLARLANAPLIPLDPLRYAPDFLKLLDGQLELAEKRDMPFDPTRLKIVANDYQAKAESVYDRILRELESDALPAEKLACINERLLTLERHWIVPSGLPEREWYRNLYAATDETSGYAAWMLPAIRYSIERKNHAAMGTAKRAYYRVFSRLTEAMSAIEACLD